MCRQVLGWSLENFVSSLYTVFFQFFLSLARDSSEHMYFASVVHSKLASKPLTKGCSCTCLSAQNCDITSVRQYHMTLPTAITTRNTNVNQKTEARPPREGKRVQKIRKRKRTNVRLGRQQIGGPCVLRPKRPITASKKKQTWAHVQTVRNKRTVDHN
jgi:hypothetical protein